VFGTSTFANAPFASLAGSIYNSTVSETGTATDSTVGFILFPASIVETGTATDVISSIQTFVSFIAETGTVTEVALVAPSIFNAPVLETGTATDAVSSNQTFVSFIVETGTATDSAVCFVVFSTSITETGTATDVVGSTQTFISSIAELATATDSVSMRLLWELIDDSQTANWVAINASNATSWGTIDTRVIKVYSADTILNTNTTDAAIVEILSPYIVTLTSGHTWTIAEQQNATWTVIGTVN